MKPPVSNEDTVYRIAAAVWAVLIVVSLAVLLSGHGILPTLAHQVSPNGVTTTMGGSGTKSSAGSAK
ncbi:hypothetical protein GCM10009839_14170 [Catenulispora yoronensis]|uniref:Uncharacterized protein n=1 Tax=Catenulispora yoronensis TaxID=450799 RepID=A0ABP5F7D8_9ACTN